MLQVGVSRRRTADDELTPGDATHVGNGDIANTQMHARRAGRQCCVDATVNNHRRARSRDERARYLDYRLCTLVRQPQLDHRRAAAANGLSTREQTRDAVPQIVRDRD